MLRRDKVHMLEDCEHTRILRALVEHPQGNLEEIQQKTLQSTQEEPVGRQDRKA
jgi:hypothetical protein